MNYPVWDVPVIGSGWVIGGIDIFHHTYKPILLDTRMISSPGVRRPDQTPADRAAEVLTELRALLDEVGDRVCAIVVEPLVQAAAGMLTHDVSFLRGVRALSTEYGAYLLTDEVATGIGRTGTMWAVEQADIAPDLLTCGKGLTGGVLPLSAVLTTEEIYASTRQVAEGAKSCSSIVELAHRTGVDAPIAEHVDLVVQGRATASELVEAFTSRDTKAETD